MWIVKLGLRRPYTLAVVAILLFVLGGITIQRTPTDILPNIDIPVVSAIWQYRGLSADEMERRITTASERSFTTTVSDIEHMESVHASSGASGPADYQQAVRELSRALDELALAAASEDTRRIQSGLAQCSQLANKAYGLAL